MRDLLYFLMGSALVAPIIVCLMANSTIIALCGLVYAAFLWRMSYTRVGLRIYRRIVRSTIRIEKTLGLW